jgi:hypothetical protein
LPGDRSLLLGYFRLEIRLPLGGDALGNGSDGLYGRGY